MDADAGVSESAAFGLVRGWVDGWSVPSEGADVGVEGVEGVRVVIRSGGRVVGSGSAWTGVRSEGALAEATEIALRRAGVALRRAAGPGTAESDAVLMARDALRVQVSFAGRLVPIDAGSVGEAALGVRPGLDGVAARAGGDVRVIFPGELRERGVGAERGIFEALRRAGVDAAGRAGALGDGVVVYRFGVTTIGEFGSADGGVRAVELFRGGRAVEAGDVTREALLRAADGVARQLMSMRRDGEARDDPIGGVAPGWWGRYESVEDRYEGIEPELRAEALAAYALARYARVRGVDPALSERARTYGVEFLSGSARSVVLASASAAEASAARSVGVSLVLLAWSELARAGVDVSGGEDSPLRSMPGDALTQLRAVAGKPAGDAAGAQASAMAALALARAAPIAERDAGASLEAARGAVRALFRGTDRGGLVSLMPWLGWAELELARGGEVPAATALLEMRELIAAHRLGRRDTGADERDLVGGVVFTRGRAPLPTWQTTRATAFEAAMLGDARLTDADEFAVRARDLRDSLRFVLNLTVSEAEASRYPTPARALGGVREAVWSDTITLDANAMGLLTLVEALEALRRR